MSVRNYPFYVRPQGRNPPLFFLFASERTQPLLSRNLTSFSGAAILLRRSKCPEGRKVEGGGEEEEEV